MTTPTGRGVLAALATAGEPGLLSGDIATTFDAPVSRGQRQRNTNEVLRRLHGQGQVRKGDLEHSPRTYHGIPSYRWYITDAGRQALSEPIRPSQQARRAQRRQEYQQNLARRQRVIAAIIKAGYGPATPQCRKLLKIRELRAQGLTQADLGSVFGLTPARIGQLAQGIRVTPCRCSSCRPAQHRSRALTTGTTESHVNAHGDRPADSL